MDVTRTEETACPLCHQNIPKGIYTIDRWKVVQCTACDFVYVNPRLPKAALYQLYTDNYFDNTVVGYYHYTENRDLRKQNFRKWVTDALPHLPNDKVRKALDVGCAAGYCLEVFAEQGWEPHGIELDKSLAESVRGKGFFVFDLPLLKLDTKETFSVITLFDVIEHLTDLHENMQKLHALLDDDGVVVLVTPDYHSWQRRLFGKRWFQFKPVEHINYFSIASLQHLADNTGFEVVEHKRSGQYCDASFLENRLRKYRFPFLLQPFHLLRRLLRLGSKSVYVDTASLYAVLRKGEAGRGAAAARATTLLQETE